VGFRFSLPTYYSTVETFFLAPVQPPSMHAQLLCSFAVFVDASVFMMAFDPFPTNLCPLLLAPSLGCLRAFARLSTLFVFL